MFVYITHDKTIQLTVGSSKTWSIQNLVEHVYSSKNSDVPIRPTSEPTKSVLKSDWS